MNTTQLLLELSALTGVSGREGPAAQRLKELLTPYGRSRPPLLQHLCHCPGA